MSSASWLGGFAISATVQFHCMSPGTLRTSTCDVLDKPWPQMFVPQVFLVLIESLGSKVRVHIYIYYVYMDIYIYISCTYTVYRFSVQT